MADYTRKPQLRITFQLIIVLRWEAVAYRE